jgi:hypothetical protein
MNHAVAIRTQHSKIGSNIRRPLAAYNVLATNREN